MGFKKPKILSRYVLLLPIRRPLTPQWIMFRLILLKKIMCYSCVPCRCLYIDELRQNGYEDSNYRSEKLLSRLQKPSININLRFSKVERNKGSSVLFWLIYSSNIIVANALAQAFALKSTDRYQDVVFCLRDFIQRGI